MQHGHEETCCPDLILAADVAALPYQEAYQALVGWCADWLVVFALLSALALRCVAFPLT
jgi:hypothetical protein